jgi:hypothetical protein
MKSSDWNAECLPGLAVVLKEWSAVVTALADDWTRREPAYQDVPFWYFERPHVGMFAGAVWRTEGGLAFEEFTYNKGAEGAYKLGRCDLWFKVNNLEYYCEAKCSISEAVDNPLNIEADGHLCHKLGLAKDDAMRMEWIDPAHMRLAMLFVSVEVQVGQNLGKALGNWQRQFRYIRADARAYVFPESLEFRADKKIFPGCAILVARI